MNFNDRDSLTLLYWKIFIRNHDVNKINIDYDRLEKLYYDPKTFPKYKTIINDILKVAKPDWNNKNTKQSTSAIFEHQGNDLDHIIKNLDYNDSFVNKFENLKTAINLIGLQGSIDYIDLVKINALIKSLILQAIYENKPELEFLMLRNLILLIVKFGIFDAVAKTGLIKFNFKFFLTFPNETVPKQLSNVTSYNLDSRLEIVYLLFKNNYKLFKNNYQILFGILLSDADSSSKELASNAPELRVKVLKLITNLTIENKIYMDELFFEKYLFANFIKLIPDFEFNLKEKFNTELLNSIVLLLENHYPTLDYTSEKQYFVNLIRLLEKSYLKDKEVYDSKVNINLLKLLIIIGLDLKRYPRARVISLFERDHLSKLKTVKKLSNEYKNLIIKTLFYTHVFESVEAATEDPLLNAYNNIKQKPDLNDCPSPITYKIEAGPPIKDNIKLSSDDLGKINSIYLRNSKDMGFTGDDINDSTDNFSTDAVLFVTQVPHDIREQSDDANKTYTIEDEIEELSLKFSNVYKSQSFFSSLSSKETTTSAANRQASKKFKTNLDLSSKLKNKKFFGIGL